VEGLVITLVLDGKIKGKIDQDNGLLIIDQLRARWIRDS